MNALSVRQPWASLILAGVKRIENRTWRVSHRGPLLIHASKQVDEYGVPLPPGLTFPGGVLLGQVELTDIVRLSEVAGQPFALGPWCWILSQPRRFALPIAFKGRLLVFEVEDAIIRAA